MTIDLKLTPRRDALLLGHNNTLDVLVRAVGPAASGRRASTSAAEPCDRNRPVWFHERAPP